MNTIKNLVLFLFAAAVVVSCNKATYKKTPGGMPYQLFKGNDTQRIYPGDYVMLEFKRKIKDSVYITTEGIIPIFMKVPPVVQPYDISELWSSLRVGDSIITTQMMDTMINRSPQDVDPKFKKGDRIITYIKILKVFTNDSAARSEYEKLQKDFAVKEIKDLEKFLADKKITTQKTPSGAYVEMLSPGTGNQIDSGKYVSVNYTGTSWSGKKFDSNTDSAFQHVGPYPFVVGAQQMIKGFDEAVLTMKLGGHARVYIPSMLGYAAHPTTPLIKPYESLIFDISVVDVKDKAPAAPPQTAPPTRVEMQQPKK